MKLLMTAAIVLATTVVGHAQSEKPPAGDRQALAPTSKCFEDEPAAKKVAAKTAKKAPAKQSGGK